MKAEVRFSAKTQRTAKLAKNFASWRSFASLREPAIRRAIIALVCFNLLFPLTVPGQRTEKPPKLAVVKPESVGMSSERLAKIDEAVLESIARKETPGAVVLVARKGRTVYRKAFGDRATEPK